MAICFKDPTDERLLRIYCRENNTQRGEDNSAQAGPIASAIRYLARQSCARAQPTRKGSAAPEGNFYQGIGKGSIAKLLGFRPGPSGAGLVDIQIANLKASGDYTRIIEEVEQELGADAPEMLKKEVARAKIKHPRTFDAAGVQRVLKTPKQVMMFRKIVTGESMRVALPVERQADLAKALVEKAAKTEREVSGRYLRDESVGMMLDTKAISRSINADERAELEQGNWEARAENLMADVARYTRSIVTNMQALVKHCQSRPKGVTLHQTGDFADAMDNLQRILAMKGKLK